MLYLQMYRKGVFIMKKYTIKALAAMLLAASILSFSACGKDNNSSEASTADSSVSAVSDTSKENDSSSTDEESSEQSDDNSKPEASDPIDEKEKGDLPPLADDDGSDVGIMTDGGILIYNRTAYEMFYGNESLAKDYADAVSTVKKALGDKVKVYNVVVPTHCGVTLPDRFFDEYGITDQNEYIKTIFDSYSEDIVGINTYNTIAHHRDEYIYFNSDHHWTGLAAYYAYRDFCKTAGVEPLKLSEMIEGTIEGYYGSLTNWVDASLLEPDVVHYFTAEKDTETFIYDDNGENEQQTRLFHDYAEGANAYGVFLGGDNPLTVCRNKDGNGKKIAILKESYGNAFSPYIALTYSETHMLDFRYLEFDFLKYIEDNNIDEVIIVNNTMASATPMRCDELRGLVD